MKGKITAISNNNNNNTKNEKLAFKSNATFRSCILKISNTFTEDLNIVIPMYDLLEYSDNYFMTTGSSWSYYRDRLNDGAN